MLITQQYRYPVIILDTICEAAPPFTKRQIIFFCSKYYTVKLVFTPDDEV